MEDVAKTKASTPELDPRGGPDGMEDAAKAQASAPVVSDGKLPLTGIDEHGRPWQRIYLDKPLDRHGTKYTNVVVKKPIGSDCQGASLTALNQADVSALAMVLPRVTEPALSKHEVLAMGIDDLGELAGAVIGFLLTKAVKAELGLTE